jgi:hypothetical protein
MLVVGACAETASGQPSTTTTTGAQCLDNGTSCVEHNECCSAWCVNGECTRRQP